MPTATFRAEIEKNGRERVRVARVTAGDLPIKARQNLGTDTIVWGGDGKKITVGQKRALLALCRELERSYGPLGTDMPPEKDLLIRSTCYYADAPVGYELKNMTLGPPRSEERADPGTRAENDFVNISYREGRSADVVDTSARQCDEAIASGDPVAMRAACYRGGEDGIRYLTCRYRTHRMFYDLDAWGICYGFQGRKYTGPCAWRCRGRCGPDCVVRGGGIYTRDCAEHDDCSYRTGSWSGPLDGNCGDEFREAANDTAFGSTTCWRC